MPAGRMKIAVLLVSIGLASCVQPLLARKKQKEAPPSALDDQKRAFHALNRLTFGPRPGDVQRVMAIGVDQWIDLQLHPERIDDSALNEHLEPFRTLRMSTKELAESFPDGQEINQVKNGKRPMPSDAALRMVYQVQIERQQEKKDRKQEAAKNSAPLEADGAGKTARMDPSVSAAKLAPEEEDRAQRGERALYADLDVQQLPELPADQRFKKILGMSTDEQVEVADSLRRGKGQALLEGLSPKEEETLLAMNNPAGVVTVELAQAKLLRAIYSERQLEEVMTDFWFNHFNVFVDKGVDRLLVTSYERDVIRPHALGKFEDLLVATAKSPAMLFYLDNWLSVGPHSPQALGIPLRADGPYIRPPSARSNGVKKRSGLNENYGRELLELHTLSVNGGYSQRDVTEVAKVFTGWTIEKPYQGGAFKFEPRMHEPGPKLVLGHRIKPKGEAEGLELLHKLATSPQTAHFISLKLAERLVSDDPPAALVDRLAKTFLTKKGDIRELLTVLFHSPEFWDEGTYRAKVKTPLEFVVSTVRATGADMGDPVALVRQLNNMGMPLYGAQPPTGYSMKAEAWVSSSALLNRMNFALALTSGRIKDVNVDAVQLVRSNASEAAMDSNLALSTLENILLDGDVSKQTHDSIAAQTRQENKPGVRNPADAMRPQEVSTMAGLLLGSPEFQRR
ncbi:MAG: DUF1800 domain-containing protein [Candidatus Sulfotelmatobacter sp.]